MSRCYPKARVFLELAKFPVSLGRPSAMGVRLVRVAKRVHWLAPLPLLLKEP